MGFWGTFLVARGDRPLPDLDGVGDLADHIGWHGTGRTAGRRFNCTARQRAGRHR
jgi:hypothetical protein